MESYEVKICISLMINLVMFSNFSCTCVCVLVAQSCLTLCNPMDCNLPGSSGPWNSPRKNTGVSCHALLETFSIQESNLGLLHCRQILYHLSHLEAPFHLPTDHLYIFFVCEVVFNPVNSDSLNLSLY